MGLASKIKNALTLWLCAMVVTLSFGETRAGEFFAAPQLESGQIQFTTQASIGENYDASRYDASGYAVAANSAPLRIAPFDDFVTVAGGQRHHLNQTAAFRDRIPRGRGESIELQGNIFRDAGAPHTRAHQSLEGFWNTYRGTDIVPTNLQYTRALQQSLRAAGLPEAHVQQAIRASIRERVRAGALGGMEVPRVPRPIRNLAQ